MSPTVTLDLLSGRFAVARLAPGAPWPAWALVAVPPVFLARTPDELSIVALETVLPGDITAQGGFRALRVRGPLDLAMVGVMASLAEPLARAGISLLAIGTFDTDYLFVAEDALESAIAALRTAGHEVCPV